MTKISQKNKKEIFILYSMLLEIRPFAIQQILYGILHAIKSAIAPMKVTFNFCFN